MGKENKNNQQTNITIINEAQIIEEIFKGKVFQNVGAKLKYIRPKHVAFIRKLLAIFP